MRNPPAVNPTTSPAADPPWRAQELLLMSEVMSFLRCPGVVALCNCAASAQL